jgi:cytosine/adenosine deaminase-related metal-dependent hydrolase
VIEAQGRVVLPGLVNVHTHAIYNLLRGGLSDDRVLYDWLLNVTHPGLGALDASDAGTAASLFCIEALLSGITTFVDNADSGRFPDIADATLAAYDRFGVRAIYARMFTDLIPPEVGDYSAAVLAKEPDVAHIDITERWPEALESITALMDRHHGRADGRIHVWPAPGVATFTSREGLLAAKDLARRRGTGLTIHVAESAFDRTQAGVSSIEYLATIGFLGPEVLAAHCVQVDANDIRMLRRHDVKVAYNPVSNMFLGSGIAPVAEMLAAGLTVGIGTDDPNCNNSVNMLSDMKFAALAQKARYRHAAAVTAERTLEMATLDGARAIGLAGEIGSLEAGKKADLIMVQLGAPQTVPVYAVPSVLVYQARGDEVDTVVVDGRVLVRDRVLTMLEEGEQDAILQQAQRASEAVVERAGLTGIRDRGWRSDVSV